MNKFEFKEVLKQEGINNTYSFTSGRYGEHEDVYYWNDLAIYFYGTYFCIIRGNIPKEVAQKLYELDLLNKHLSFKGTDKNNKDTKTVDYHIDTVEGFILFIEVYKQYLYGMLDDELDITNKVNDVKTNLLRLSRTNCSNDEWINKSSNYKDVYNTTVNSNDDELTVALRDKINEYDKAVNPFLNEELNNITDKYDLSKLNISINHNPGECHIKMLSEDKNIESFYNRDRDGFIYVISFYDENGDIYTCNHYFTKTLEGDCTGEVIKVCKTSKSYTRVSYTFTYNLTNDTFEFTDGKVIPAIMEVKSQIIDELDRYINKATYITNEAIIDNKERKLV